MSVAAAVAPVAAAVAPVIHFLFRSELDAHARSKVPWRSLRIDACTEDGKPLSLWEDVRYVLELKCGLHGTGKGSRGFLTGMRRLHYKELGCTWDESRRLLPSDVMKAGDAIVLLRRPLPRALRMFVPARFDPEVIASKAKAMAVEQERALQLSMKQEELARRMQTMSEDERLVAVASGAADATELMPTTKKNTISCKPSSKWQHPDEYEFEADTWVRPMPPAEYVCKGCSEVGAHFRVDCPRDTETVAVAHQESGVTVRVDMAVDKIQLSHGIPKMFLKRVNFSSSGNTSSDAPSLRDAKEALTTREGEMVVDVRSTLAKPVITVEPRRVLELVEARHAKTAARRVDDEEDVWFDFEPYVEAHDELYAAELEKVHIQEPYLRRKLQSMCTHWLRGICHKGVLCEYLHVYSTEGMPICKFFLQGKCLNDECTFRHVLPPSARTRHSKPCQDYAIGFCALGPRCPHPHNRRDAPYIADFPDNEPLFNRVVAAFDAYLLEEKKEDVKARKQYNITPAGVKRLHSTVSQTVVASRGARRDKRVKHDM